MKYILLILLFPIMVLGQKLPLSPKERGWPYRIEMTPEDMSKINAGPGYVITWYDHSKWIDSNRVFAEIFNDSHHWAMKKGIICFELNESHNWIACNCAPIDKFSADLQYRYKHDKEFKRKEDSAIRLP